MVFKLNRSPRKELGGGPLLWLFGLCAEQTASQLIEGSEPEQTLLYKTQCGEALTPSEEKLEWKAQAKKQL